jgi:FKBP-type peptidyl-prolyl cis-trans isomerase FkpA
MYGDLKIRCNNIPVQYLLILFLSAASISCKNNSSKPILNNKPGKNEMADLNRYFVQKDRERIQNYIERKNLKMSESPTGLWYQIVNEGEGACFTDNSKVILEYECSLLDGAKCYSSKKLGPKELILGKSKMEPGLNEGLRLLKPGAEAIFILPPFLAFGLPGDGKMIPSRAVIVYNVNILRSR